MPRPKMPVAEKKLRGTYEASRDAPANPGRIRLTTPIEPPGDLDKAAQSEWQLHMQLCLQAGTLAVTDLRALRLLAETAVMVSRAYQAAMKTGPVSHGDRGSKVSPEWQAWTTSHARYTALLDRFGLVPMSARQVPMLPPARGAALREVS
jgi:phage terminase small subunit